MKAHLLTIIILASTAIELNSWPTGAPEEACETLTPQHGANRPKAPSQSPFTVTQSQNNFEPGDRIKGKQEKLFNFKRKTSFHSVFRVVVVQAPPGISFKGLIVQAIDASTGQPLGLFEPGRGLKVLDSCSAVTHSDRRGKRAATLVWDAPQTGRGRVAFKASVVQRFSEFYTGLQSNVNPNV